MLDTRTLTALRPEHPRHEQAAAGPAGFAFGPFVLRRRERLLLCDGAPVGLSSRAVEVLLALVEADGALLTKDALLDRVWPGVTVEESNLRVQVSALRHALGRERRAWIATIPGRGYRFIGPVAALQAPDRMAPVVPPAMAATAAAAQHPAQKAEPPSLSVLVLPFAARGGDPAQDWFVDAITDSLTTDLARALPGCTVIAQTTADTYKGHPADVREIGREQGVRYVVEGSVLLADNRVRVNAQLVAAETGAHLWADRFDTPRRDVLQVQDEIVGRLSRSVGLQMVDAEVRRAEHAEHEHSGRTEAQDYVLRGRAAANQRMMARDSIEAACALYASALERDPGNVEALAGIACVRVYQGVNGYPETGETLARALATAPDHFAALKGRAVLLRARGVFEDAIAAAETVLAHNPGEPMAHREIGLSLLYLGRAEEAVDWFRRADALGPGDLMR